MNTNIKTVIEAITKGAKLYQYFGKLNVQILVNKDGITAKYYKGHPSCPSVEIFENFQGVSLEEAKEIVVEVKKLQDNQFMKSCLHYSEEIAVEQLEKLGCFDVKIVQSWKPYIHFKKEVDGQVYKAEFGLSRHEESMPFTFNSYIADDEGDSLDRLIKHYAWAMSPANPFN